MHVIKYLRETYGLNDHDVLIVMGSIAGQLINFKSRQVDTLIQHIIKDLENAREGD